MPRPKDDATPEDRLELPAPSPQLALPRAPGRFPWFGVQQILLIVNGLAGIALALAFQASGSGLRVAVHPLEWEPMARTVGEQVYFCDGNVGAYRTDDNGNLKLGPMPCPGDANKAAIVTVDHPWLFRVALVALGLTALSQAFFVKRE